MDTSKVHYFHILPDSPYSDTFISIIKELGLSKYNSFACRVNKNGVLRFVKHEVRTFYRLDELKNKLLEANEVVVHYLRGDYYKPLNKYVKSRKISLVPWGSDIYRSPIFGYQTLDKFSYHFKNRFFRESLRNFYYKLFLNQHLKKVLHKTQKVYAWIPNHHKDLERIGGKKYGYCEFNYGRTPIEFTKINFDEVEFSTKKYLVLGHSGSPGLNHLDFLEGFYNSTIKNKLSDYEFIIPVAYGDKKYISFIQKHIGKKSYSKSIKFITDYMPFEEYLKLIGNSSGYIINSSIAIGGGNIGIAIMLKKPVFVKRQNVFIELLGNSGIELYDLDDVYNVSSINRNNQRLLKNIEGYRFLLNIDKIKSHYIQHFSGDMN